MGNADGLLNSRTAAVTADVLKEYQEMITNTTADLEEHLQEIDHKLQIIRLQDTTASNGDADERRSIEEERDSTKQCLYICEWVSEHIDQIQTNTFENISTASDEHRETVVTPGAYIPAKRLTAEIFKECKERLPDTTTELRKHLQDINKRLQNFSSGRPGFPGDGGIKQAQIQEEKDSLKQCLAICAQASEQVDSVRTNIFEDVSTAHEAHQLVVATLGDLVSAKHVTATDTSTQWLGQMSDASLQQLSRDRNRIAVEKNAVESRGVMNEQFEDRYGTGKMLD